VKARPVEGLDPQAPLRPNAARIVQTRLEEVADLAPGALERSAIQTQHDLRIAAKRLRYVLELVGVCFGKEAEAARRLATELQGVLGDLHDCDVLLPRAAGIEALELDLRERREALFQRFRELWQAGAELRTLTALERALHR
jgi:CHAD domain-containing protein